MLGKSDENLYYMRLAFECERYDDIIYYLNQSIKEKNGDLNEQERQYLDQYYTKLISRNKKCIETVNYLVKDEGSYYCSSNEYKKEYYSLLIKETIGLVHKGIEQATELLKKTNDSDAITSYNQLIAVLSIYLIHYDDENNTESHKKKAEDTFKVALKAAEKIDRTTLSKIKLFYNYALFIRKFKEAFDESLSLLEKTRDDIFDELMLIEEDEELLEAFSKYVSMIREDIEQWKKLDGKDLVNESMDREENYNDDY